MPAKQTKESIEAELNESEKDRAVRKLRDVAQGALEMEKHLEEREAELGLPTFYRSRPLVERMAAIGMSQDAIDHAQTWVDALSKIVSGRGDELPDHLKKELAEDADAELVGAELLAGIVRKHPKA
jgi:lipopolysaccharide biosynthesis regulator YciM